MKIPQDLISSKNQSLYDTVSKSLKLEFQEITPPDWGCVIRNDNKALIEYSDSAHPEEAFVHELLHLDLQLKGYRRPRFAVIPRKSIKNTILSELIYALDNEFQHNKIFSDFISMGYDPAYFYNDNDYYQIKELLTTGIDKNLADTNSELAVMTCYMSLLSPGLEVFGDDVTKTKDLYKSLPQFNNIDTILTNLEDAFELWKKEDSLDCRDILKKIFSTIPSFNCYVGFDINAQSDYDFFIGNEFSSDILLQVLENTFKKSM